MKRALLSSLILVVAVALCAVLEPESASAAAIKPYAGCAANTLPANDDGSTDAVALPFAPNFFGTTYSSLYVNNNGNVTFDSRLGTYTPFSLLTTERAIIAPFFGDVDTSGAGSGIVTYGVITYGARTAFCVNWFNVGYYSRNTNKLNSFQLLLVDRSDVGVGDFDIMFNYDQIQWETGDASDGTDGLGGHSARVGYSNGVDTALELPGSAVNGAFLDSNPGGLVHDSRNSLQNGRYLFPVRGGAAPTGGTISGHVFGSAGGGSGLGGVVALGGALVQICQTGGSCNTTGTDATGEYSISGLAPGQYVGSAFPPADRPDLFPGTIGPINLAAAETLDGQDFHLTRPGPLPPGVTISSISTTATGAPVIHWGTSNQVTKDNCPGGTARYDVIKDGVIIRTGPMPEISTGTYKGTIPPLQPTHGDAVIRITVSCPNPPDGKVVDIDVYIDPSGTVRTTDGDPIAGATVTLWRSDSSTGPYEMVPDGSAIMAPSNRTNPDTTAADGVFHWDVIAGYYVVRAEAPGCVSPFNPSQSYVDTGAMQIPPPVTDLDIRLDCGEEPAVVPGDVNCGGTVDAIDAALVLQLSAGLIGLLPCGGAADVSQDGTVNSIDAALILQYSAGLIPALPV